MKSSVLVEAINRVLSKHPLLQPQFTKPDGGYIGLLHADASMELDTRRTFNSFKELLDASITAAESSFKAAQPKGKYAVVGYEANAARSVDNSDNTIEPHSVTLNIRKWIRKVE